MIDDGLSPEERAARAAERRKAELARIFQAGWDAAADAAPLTGAEIDWLVPLLRPDIVLQPRHANTAPLPVQRYQAPGNGTRHFTYETAAAELAVPERWLRTHIGSLPHRRFGRYVRFSEADIKAISALFAAGTPATVAAEYRPVAGMPDIKPSRVRRRL